VPFELTVTVSDAEPGRISISVATTERCTFADGEKKKWRSRVVGGSSATFVLSLALTCACPSGDVLNTRINVEGWDETGDRSGTSTRVRYQC
jgi:hypothetical protein